jgi:hypothetical protein
MKSRPATLRKDETKALTTERAALIASRMSTARQ